jgi:HEAT repeat protein
MVITNEFIRSISSAAGVDFPISSRSEIRFCALLMCGMLALTGCGQTASTDSLIDDLTTGSELDRMKAVRLLQHRQKDAEKVVPVLIESLKDGAADIRWSAAIGLGYYGREAVSAVPALQDATKDKDARVREAARVAISRIEN